MRLAESEIIKAAEKKEKDFEILLLQQAIFLSLIKRNHLYDEIKVICAHQINMRNVRVPSFPNKYYKDELITDIPEEYRN